MRICHVITGLPVGGAQTVLYQQVRHQISLGWTVAVCSLTETGEMGERIRALGIEVISLNLNRRWPDPTAIFVLRRWFKRLSPDVAQTWLYHGDLFGGIAARLAGVPRVFWNIRQTDLDPAGSRRSTILTARICAMLSRWVPEKIICCATAAKELHAHIGYDDKRMVVIGNGVDPERFRPDSAAAEKFRAEIHVAPDTRLVGLVARHHPQKDHTSFLDAARAIQDSMPDIVFVMCGENIVKENQELSEKVACLPRPQNVVMLGIRSDLPSIYNALDLCVSSSSFGEGFSNIIIEAMACGTPCVVTDVGDSHGIVGETGWRIAARNPKALGDAILDALNLSQQELQARGSAARERVLSHFTEERVCAAYDDLYLNS